VAGLPKKYFKMFPGNLKKGWAEYRKDRGAGGSGAKRKKSRGKKRTRARAVKRKSAGLPATTANHKHGGRKMSKRRKAVRHVARRIKAGMGTKPGQVVMAAGMAAAGGVATSLVINNVPKVKDMGALAKSGMQGAAGLAAIFFGRKRWMKSLGSGAVIAAVFGASKELLKLNPLAGPSAGSPTLPRAELQRLIANGMGLPANVRMNRPAQVSMNGGRSYGGSGWSSGWN